mmetsp:Transcript_23251/g.26755  ORF Transcript_23251/g.26755 Transcript_23251/m.26755 type:complete len:106 (-) Transcript_23251:1333-1650(-)
MLLLLRQFKKEITHTVTLSSILNFHSLLNPLKRCSINLLQNSQNLLVNHPIGTAQHIPRGNPILTPVQIRNDTPRLPNQQRPRNQIPRTQIIPVMRPQPPLRQPR